MYLADEHRYEKMPIRRAGNTGFQLPAISFGMWHSFGENANYGDTRDIILKAFDAGIFSFDLAANYGPGSYAAESLFGEVFKRELKPYRDELVISSKAGFHMWPGPYGEWGSRKYVIASCDQSLKRMGVDYVDIFYSHRFDPNTPLEETMMALDQIVRSGKALYVGISSYNSQRTKEAYDILKSLGTPFIIHQPSYSMLNRWVESDGLLDTLDNLGLGSIVFSPLAQGMLTNKYLNKVPADSRASQDKSLSKEFLSEDNLKNIWSLNEIASSRGQTLAQMAISWVLKNKSVTSALIGASRPEQVIDCVGALKNLEFSDQELHQIDQYAKDAGINIWQQSAEL